jgi:class 3 adenylate cyclase/CHASE2 domain-containing sensor protein
MAMHRGERRLRAKTALCCLGLTLVVILLDTPMVDALRPMEHWLYDRRCRYCQFFTPPTTDKLVHLDIDDNALEDIGAWPWPRDLMAEVMQEIGDAGPKAVAMDILYTEPKKTRLEPIRGAEVPATAPAASQPAGAAPATQVAVQTQPGAIAATTNPAALPPNDSPTTGPATRRAQRVIPGVEVNEDAVLASTIRRLNDVILAVSLKLNTDPSHFYPDVRDLLVRDLEMTDAEVAATLASRGMTDANLDARVREIFADARKDAAGIRVAEELKTAETEAARLRVPVPQVLYGRLLHKYTPLSPQGHAIDAGYVATLARRAARRFTLDLPAGLPTPAVGERELVPIPALSDAAAAEGFVEYPVYKDGHVRSVPLLMLLDGRALPQIGLSLAMRMLDASPDDLRITADAVTIAGRGKGGADLVIPVRALRPEGGGSAIPYTFDIPWVGTSDWQRMFRNPHLSVDKVYEVIHSREKIAENNEVADTALEYLLVIWDRGVGGHQLADFQARRPRPDDWNGRLGLINTVLDQYKDTIPEDAKEQEAGDDLETRLTIRFVQTLRRAVHEQNALQRQVDKQRSELKSIMNGRAVLIGWAATAAIADRKPTSIHPDAPGVVVHGTIFNGIMTGELWRTLPTWVTALTTLGLGLSLTALVALLPPGRALAASFALAGLFFAVNGILLFDRYNLMLGLAGPVTVMLLVWAGGTVIRLVLERYERARITARFASYVDPELVEFVLENEDQEVFKGAEREMTVVFNDLAGFTALSDRLGKQIILVLNEFMDLATRVIKRHHGYVNKFLGDGVMFFFNAPRPREDYAAEAMHAVLELQLMLEEFNVRLAQRGLPALSLRTGVTTGLMVVGDAGSSERADYTVLGDLVNLASRLESANKAVGTSNLVTDRTVELAGDRFLFRPVGQIQVVGLPTAVMVFEAIAPMASATPAQKRMVALSAIMVDASLDARPADCLEAIVKLEEEFGDCRLTQLYREKCESYLGGQTAGDFDRQIVLTQK